MYLAINSLSEPCEIKTPIAVALPCKNSCICCGEVCLINKRPRFPFSV